MGFQRKHCAAYPKTLFAIINAVCVFLDIVALLYLNNSIAFNEWQMYGMVHHRTAVAMSLIFSILPTCMGLVSLPRYFQVWQIAFTLLLLLPVGGCIGLLVSSVNLQDNLKKQLEFVFTRSEAESVREYVYMELDCVEPEQCYETAAKEVESLKSSSITFAVILFIAHTINLLVNTGFLVFFHADDAESRFADSSSDTGSSDEGSDESD